ncbi:MCE family protein [Aquihabitans sp. G128]|uniref:MCE family protein n=1 Tax=Aquihabitans sp. G128 TaxID=2849779 RepID=UPI001C21B47E|nr:MCE family protein [Aquihabitans sp. G128]QXC61957.1 MCE family protein [Aquihabitans sp. G128]
MINRRIIANLVVFFTLATLLVGYGVVTLFGSPFDHQDTLVADLPDAGGLRPGFSASHDGVVIGTVSKVELRRDEVRVTIQLDKGVTVPKGVEARVVRASAVGEQRLDLASVAGGSQEPLPDGAEVPVGADPIPPDIADVLATTTGLIEALPAKDLNTVIHEAAVGVDGRSDDLRSITRSLTTVSDDVVADDASLRKLLANGPPVLDDFSDMSPEVHDALDNTQQLTRILADRKGDLVDLLDKGADLSEVGDRVLLDNRANLTCLVGELTDITGELQGAALKDLDTALKTNTQFFGLVDKVAVRGQAQPNPYGPGRPDQLWLRTSLLLPPQTPAASAYAPPRGHLPVTTGAACTGPYGKGGGGHAAAGHRPRQDRHQRDRRRRSRPVRHRRVGRPHRRRGRVGRPAGPGPAGIAGPVGEV